MKRRGNIIVDLMPMKHAFTGTFYFCQYLMNALDKAGLSEIIKPTLFLPKSAKALFSSNYNFYEIRKFHKRFIPFKSRYKLWHITFQHSRYFPESFKGKILFTIHDLNFLYEDLSIERKKKFLTEIRRRIDRSDKVVTISEYVKNDIIQHCKVDADKIKVIYNGCTLNNNIIATAPSHFPTVPFFFTIGLVEDKKNFKVLPAMLLHNNYVLIIAGRITDLEYSKAIMDYAEALGVADRVHIVGAISDEERDWYLSKCVLLAFPSKAEGFGLPVIEAMHFGKPVLLSHATSLPEIGGEDAYYFDGYESEEVARTTDFVLRDIEAKPFLGEKMKQRANQFTWENAAKQYLELYKDMLGLYQ